MKSIIKSLAIAAVSALAFISCSREQNPISKDNGIHFTIRTSENPQVKSFIDNNLNGTYTPKWSKGDELAMFVGTIDGNTKKATGILTNTKEEDLTATFDGTVTGLPEKGTFKSFAPASAFAETCYNSGNVGVTLKDVQNPSSLTIDKACDILVAKETSYTADAAGKVAIDDLFFKRMFSVVKVALKGPASLNGEKVSKFSLSAPEGTVLTGRAAIDLTTATIDKWNIDNNSVTATYEADAPVFGGASGPENAVWLVVNPCTVASGAKVVFTGETANYTFSKEVTLSKALTFPESQLAVINLTLAEENCTKKAAASWIATDLADITATDEVVITMAKDKSVYALTSANGSSKAPTAVAVTVENKELTAAPADDLVWNIIANANGELTIYPKGQTATWLYTTNDNNGVRVGTNDNKTFVVDSEFGYLYNTVTKRYLGTYNGADWRCYTSMHANISGQTLCFYIKGTPKTALETPANLQVSAEKVVSWNAVSGAASYEVTIGKDVFTSETNSYDAATVADDYYDVSVVAVPSDKENYKNSAAATLTGVKFGTPTLTTPELTEGAIDEASIRVNMAVDARATNGCTCEIYKGETLVESKTIKVNYVVFSKLESGVTYTVKVNAIAVEGEKPYAASDVASIELKTKPAQHVSDVTAAGTYTIKGLTVYAVANTSVAIAGDNTGYILVYKKSHGLNVGNTFDAAGNAELYNGVWELNTPSITNIKNGETPIYPNAVEATEEYLNAYASSQRIQYVHIKGIQTGKYIEVGGTKVFMETPNTEMEGKVVDAYGFTYGYSTKHNNANFVVTSIKEDQTIPTLSVDQTSKVWAADATDAFVVNVAVNSEGGDWTVTPETLPWATIAVDKAAGTITITPNRANETETANEATLTVTHTTDVSLTKEISLKQNGVGGAALTEKTATIQFGTDNVKINQASVTANDNQKNSWTITTVGTKSFNPNPLYYQVGSKNSAAKSITFTTTLPEDAEVTSISAKFGGNSSTAGTITLKVGETIVGTGALNGTNDVTVTSTSTAVGNKVTITVTKIAKGVKCYNIQVKYKTAN